jgi:signal transduction histidine kinase
MVQERTRQLIHADRLASLGTLSAGIAHEINNPTTFITGNLQTLEQFWKKLVLYLEQSARQDPLDPKLQYILDEFPSMIRSIRNGADRINNIVSGLKMFARKDTTIKEWIDFNNVLQEALSLTHNRLKYNIEVAVEIDEKLPNLWANEQQMVQVMVNLLVNAADAIGDKAGRIQVSARSAGPGRVEIEVDDSGAGMPPEIAGKIFDPFFTTKPVGEGTGLGLSITHGIIQDHQGSIQVDSRVNQGTTFTISLPTEKDQ